MADDERQRVYIGGIDSSRGLNVSDVVNRIQSRTASVREIHLGSTYAQFNVDSKATYDTIHSMFNNVQWKGCKLVVELARPHFLERLRLERVATEVQRAQGASTPAAEATGLRRHWKVKRRYGEPAYKVDTTPYTTESWEMFAKAAKRARGKQATGDEKYASRHNRSIRLQFGDVEDRIRSHSMVKSKDKVMGNESSSSSSSTSEDSAESVRNETRQAKDQYVWSDDDESDSSTWDNENTEDIKKKEFTPLTTLQPKLADEFASAVNFNNEQTVVEAENQSLVSREDDFEEEGLDLSGDVERNMALLEDVLGPETAEPSNMAESIDRPRKSTPLMVRFDPTASNAQENYILESEDDDENEDEDEEQVNTSDPLPNADYGAETSVDPVYEQGKLEAVFKESRELDPSRTDNSSATFSFGFQLADDEESGSLQQHSVSEPTENFAGSSTEDYPQDVGVAVIESADPPDDQLVMRAFEFPSEETLDAILHSYFYDYEGGRMMNDLEAWRQDETVREKWLKERNALTMDWKNKRKAALERKRPKGRRRF